MLFHNNRRPLKLGKLSQQFLLDDKARPRRIKRHYRRGKGTRFVKKMVASGLVIAASMFIFPKETNKWGQSIFFDGYGSAPPPDTTAITMPLNDPLFHRQWHLQNTGQDGGQPGMDINVVPTWRNYTGQGTKLGVFELFNTLAEHPELKGRTKVINSTNHPIHKVIDHGTHVANIAAGRANNEFGGVGVAPSATLLTYSGNTSENFESQKNVDVTNASWIYSKPFGGMRHSQDNGEERGWFQSLVKSIREGRDGKGTIWVVAAGNDFENDHDTNLSGLSSNRFVNVIAAIDNQGKVAEFSSPGASILASAPGKNLILSDSRPGDDDAANVSKTGSGTSMRPHKPAVQSCLSLRPTHGWDTATRE